MNECGDPYDSSWTCRVRGALLCEHTQPDGSPTCDKCKARTGT